MKYQPMLAMPASELPEAEGWCIQPKIDGWRCLVEVDADGVKMFTRSGERCESPVVYLQDSLRSLTPGTVLDGEVYAGSWGATQSIMTRSIPHVPNDLLPAAELLVFDVLQVGVDSTVDLPLNERLDIVGALGSMGLPFIHDLPTSVAVCEENHVANLELGFEGSVVKKLDSLYRPGKRPTWVKVKSEETEDCTILGYKDGKGSFQGLVGALIVGLESGVTTTVSGFSLEQRVAFTRRPGEFQGKTVEIKHNGIMKSGKPRHPRFFRFRPDKDGGSSS